MRSSLLLRPCLLDLQFNRILPCTWRVTNQGDAVTLVPRLLGYCHVGHKVVLSNDSVGIYSVERDTADALVEGAAATEVALAVTLNLPVLAEQVLGPAQEQTGEQAAAAPAAAEGQEGVSAEQPQPGSSSGGGAPTATAAAAAATIASAQGVQEVLEQEVDALMRLVDGTALLQHLEPVYFENIKGAVDKLVAESKKDSGL